MSHPGSVYVFVVRNRNTDQVIGSLRFPIHGPIRGDEAEMRPLDNNPRPVAWAMQALFERVVSATAALGEAIQREGSRLNWNFSIAEDIVTRALKHTHMDIAATTSSVDIFERNASNASYHEKLEQYVRERRQIWQGPNWGQVT